MKKMLLSVALLGLSSVAVADLSPTCQLSFNQLNALVSLIPADKVSSSQMSSIKQNMELAKKQLVSLPTEKQDAICIKSMDLLKEIISAQVK